MSLKNAFTVYNAAAGAGKTYTLVKAYLITLLKGEFADTYKTILALTFTNKAVAEMKTRVLENLEAISSSKTPASYQELIQELVHEVGITESELKQKANRILKNILHNYAAFDIVTIDTFTHRVIRTFAYDLGIPMSFEIEMDTESLIGEAVDAVIAKVGTDNELTKIIIDFSISKLDDDKSWDITAELHKAAKLLFAENDREHLNRLVDKSPQEFEALKHFLRQRITETKKDITSQSIAMFRKWADHNIEIGDFKGNYIPNHFQKLIDGNIKIDFKKTKWLQNIETTDFYNKTLDSDKKSRIDSIRPQIEHIFSVTRQQIFQVQLYENIIKNLTPLSVLNAINKELLAIKKERKILLISEFNTIISDAIQDQPAPFIYERLGEKYRDYFIDEFQDTSEMQWNNLIPLIDNALSTETLTGKRGQLTIVGDAKQAIYRWRGGKAEQFINLSGDENPFSIKEKKTQNLPKNYRSHKHIIKFNNDFFTFLSNDFIDEMHRKLYLQGNKQEYNAKEGGYVNVSFIDAKNVAEENEIYPLRVYETIIELRGKGYRLDEICILVRRQKEGAAVADYLTEKDIPILSSETLLINNAPEVTFIINLLSWYVQPDNLTAKINMLHFVSDRFSTQEKHAFLEQMIEADKKTFSSTLKTLNIDFSFATLALLPLYHSVEYIIKSFNLGAAAPAYLQFFLDTVFSFSQKHTEGIIGFLSYWDHKKDTLSIVAPKGEGAVNIMTIHKAKGLEFPCVIYPYANIDIYRELEPKAWLAVNPENYNGFEEVFINYNQRISDYSAEAERLVHNRNAQLELDALNLLYVALTRAEEQLYIISKLDVNSKGEANSNKFSGKLIQYLQHIGQWNAEQSEYVFGNPSRFFISKTSKENKIKNIKLSKFDTSGQLYKITIVTNSGKLWDTSQKKALEKGNLIHELLASVFTFNDVDEVVDKASRRGEFPVSDKELLRKELKKIVEHPELSPHFSGDNHILNEKEIITNGQSFRPDRISIKQDTIATIIDYKTGSYVPSHEKQLVRYGEILKKLGYTIDQKILVYINETLTLKFV